LYQTEQFRVVCLAKKSLCSLNAVLGKNEKWHTTKERERSFSPQGNINSLALAAIHTSDY
jgi:hypothetical protein